MKHLYPLLIVALIALTAGHYIFSPKELYIVHQCSLQVNGRCVVSDKGVTLDLRLSPFPIIPTEDVQYLLRTEGITVEKATIRLLGHDMNMPRDEQVFDLNSLLDPNRLEATRVFPICTEKVMTWRVYVVLKGKEKWVRTTFDLKVKRLEK